jgi:hypothetical protein
MTLGDSYGGFQGRAGWLRLGRRPAAAKWGGFSLLIAIVAALLVAVAQPAKAGIGFSVVPTFPSVVTVGQAGVPAALTITNNSTFPNDANPIRLQPVTAAPNAITLVPSCGSTIPAGLGDCSVPDPGVFNLSPTGTGEAGTACAGTLFTITPVDATGKVAFTPVAPVVLQPPGSGADTCRINFTIDVLRVPTIDSQAGAAGVQTSQIGFVQGIDTVTNEGSFNNGVSSVTVLAAQATIVTSATPQVTIGSPISDTATVSGVGAGLQPTGTVTFTLFGPNDPTCAGTQLLVPPRVVPLAGGPPPTANSGPFTPTAVGTYNWVAVYSGDANYLPATSPCGAPNESSVVAAAVATIVTSATTPVTLGSPISDTATVTGAAAPAPAPTGTVTFTLYGPNDPTCAGAQLLVPPRVVPLAGGPPATANSGPFTPTAVGTYNWVAVYSGDANYDPATSPCGAPNEASVVTQATPAIVTSATTPVTIGSPISDTATVTGPVGATPPTGTVTFTLFGPNDPTCAGAQLLVPPRVVPLAGGPPPTANSGDFTPPAPGTYNWVAVYSGDANYTSVTSPCGAPNEASVVNQAVATIVTSATPVVTIGSPISDTATVTGAASPAPAPTGTVTFTLYGPNDPTCAGNQLLVPPRVVPLAGGPPPTANSGPFTPPAVGTYNWVAVYNGDANYAPVTSPCGAPNESSVVNTAVATIVTNATPTAAFGAPISDTATVTGAVAPAPTPTGTVTFTLFGPNDPTCAGTQLLVPPRVVPLTGGPPPTANSGPFTPTVAGSYNWVAVYSGDANYPSVTSPCGAPNETSVVAPPVATIVTAATPTVTISQPISDTATVSGPAGAPAPTGTVTFTLFGPNDPTCAGAQLLVPPRVVPLAGGPPPTANSGPFTPTAVGTYNWVAVYSGDAIYASATSPCGAPNEASVVTALPTIDVDKTATPLTRPEPGGDFTFNVVVTNTSNQVLTITSLTDDIYGDITTRANSTCTTAIGTVLPPTPGPGNTYSCSFTAPFTGNDGDFQVDTVTVRATNPVGVEVTAADDARVDLTDEPPLINIVKDATPLTRPEPGGDFTYNITVTNPSTIEAVTITSLTDSVYGDLSTRGTCTTAIGTVLAVNGGSYSCSFTAPFSGNGGDALTDIATVIGEDDDGTEVTDSDDAVVTLTDVLPIISVDKTVRAPASLPEPGGQFTFDVVVTNLSAEPVTITTLTDNIYGNIANQGTCTSAVGTVLTASPGPGNTYTCSFTGNFTGNSGASQTDIVTATAVDDDDNTATDDDDAVVTITNVNPAILVEKSASPASRPEPGGQFTFSVVVTNTGPEPLTITTLTDDIYGNIANQGTCTTAVGTVLQPGGTYSCSFPGNFTGVAGATQTDVVTVTGVDDDGTTVTDTDDAVVTITGGPPTVLVVKTATPLSRPEPGGQFTFNVVVTNTSATEAVTITALTDNIYGNIATQGTCTTAVGTVLQPGGSYSCSFTGNFTGNAGASQTDIVTVRVVDDDGQTATDDDDAVVTITDIPPVITVVKTATPLVRNEPGGSFTFDVLITNTGTETVTIDTLTDDVYGNLNGRGTCQVGAVLQPAGTYRCSFNGDFFGNAGASQTDTVTASGVDNDGTRVTARDDAIVRLVDVPPTVTVIKDADPVSRPEPGGSFTFLVTITNTSFEPVTVVAITDNIYGNLNGRGTCAVGAVLQPGASYKCQFTVDSRGAAGASQVDTVTATVVDNDGTRASDTDDARISLTPVGTPPVSPPLARTGGGVGGPARLAFGLLLAGLLMVGITMRSRGRLVFAPSGGMAWFTGSPAGTALRGLVDGLRTDGGRIRPHPSDDPDSRLGFHDVDPDDHGPYDAGHDDDGPDDDGPPSGGPTAGGAPPSGRGPSGGGYGAAAPIAESSTETDRQAPSEAPPAGRSAATPPTVYEWEAAIARSTPTVGEPIPAAPEPPPAPQDQPFDVSLLPPPVFPTPPKKGNRITRLI